MKKIIVIVLLIVVNVSVILSLNAEQEGYQDESIYQPYLASLSFSRVELSSDVWDGKINKSGAFHVNIFQFGFLDGIEDCDTLFIALPHGLSFEDGELYSEEEVCSPPYVDDELGLRQIGGFEKVVYVVEDAELGVYNINSSGRNVAVEVVDDPKIQFTGQVSSSYVKIDDSGYDYVFNIKNIGDFIMRNTQIDIDYSEEEITMESVKIDTQDYEMVTNDNRLTISVPDLEPGEEKKIFVHASVKEGREIGTSISTTATASADYADDVSIQNTVTVAEPKLNLQISSNKEKVKRGEEVEFELTVENIGNISSSLGVLRAIFDESLELLDLGNGTLNENEVKWTITNNGLDSNQNLIFRVRARVKEDAIIDSNLQNVATLETDNQQLEERVALLVQQSNLQVIVSSDKESTSANEEINYTIRIKNENDFTVKNVVVVQKMSDYLIIEHAEGGEISNNTVTYKIDEIDAGQEFVFTIKTRVKNNINEEQIIENEINVDQDGLIVDNISNEGIIVRPSNQTNLNDIENPKTGLYTGVIFAFAGIIVIIILNYYLKHRNYTFKL